MWFSTDATRCWEHEFPVSRAHPEALRPTSPRWEQSGPSIPGLQKRKWTEKGRCGPCSRSCQGLTAEPGLDPRPDSWFTPPGKCRATATARHTILLLPKLFWGAARAGNSTPWGLGRTGCLSVWSWGAVEVGRESEGPGVLGPEATFRTGPLGGLSTAGMPHPCLSGVGGLSQQWGTGAGEGSRILILCVPDGGRAESP